MNKRFFVFLLIAAAVHPVFSASLEELAGAERAAALRRGEMFTEVQLKNPRPLLLPEHGELRRISSDIQRLLEPGILVETLSLYQKPASAGQAGWSAEEKRSLYNESLALSSLAGIQYYSASRKQMRTFYETSFVIDGPVSKKKIDDPFFAAPPSELTVYTRQKDLTFGDNVYRYEYRAGPDSLIFVQENLTAMNVGIITAVGKNKLRTVVAVIDAGDCLLVYAASMAKAASFPGLGERIGNSFTNRAGAILKWFAGRADLAFSLLK
jgi:hypothetical protein